LQSRTNLTSSKRLSVLGGVATTTRSDVRRGLKARLSSLRGSQCRASANGRCLML
jgi:hypothetical protein